MRVEREVPLKRHAQLTMLFRRAAGESWALIGCSVCASGYGAATQGGPRMTRTTLGWDASALQAGRGERRAGKVPEMCRGGFGVGRPRKHCSRLPHSGSRKRVRRRCFQHGHRGPDRVFLFSCAVLVIHTLVGLAAAQHRSPNMRIGFVRSSPRFPCRQHSTPFSRTRAAPMACSRRLGRRHKVLAKQKTTPHEL